MILITLVVALTAAAGASRAESPLDLASGGMVVVSEALDGETVRLEDGRIVRLSGIEAPLPPTDRWRGGRPPLVDQARVALAGLVAGRSAELRLERDAPDRHGRLLAHLVRDDGVWIEGELVGAGLARVHGQVDQRRLLPELLTLEQTARTARTGIWRTPYYAVRTPETLDRDTDSFQIVEGRVMSANRVRDQVYLNFGPDWHTDFTIAIAKPALKSFPDPLALAGRVIRVRGWVTRHNGPMIEATFPEQIERLDGD